MANEQETAFDHKVLEYLRNEYPEHTDSKMGEVTDEEFNFVFFEMVDDLRIQFHKEAEDMPQEWANYLVERYIHDTPAN